MSIIDVNGINIDLDQDGYMINSEEWNAEIGEYLATLDSIDCLTESHWKVINYLRDYVKKFGCTPMTRKLCKETGFTLKEIRTMFSCSCIRRVYKVAGLPKPSGCV